MKFKISAITTVTMFGVGICIAASGRFGTSHAPMPTPPIPPAPVGGYNWAGTNWPGRTAGDLVLNDLGGNKASIISHSENYAARNLVIPDEVEKDGNILHIISIAATAFGNCDNLVDSITIGNNVLSIGEGAFRSASNLSGNLFLPPHINSIGSDAFYDCGFNEKLTLHGNIHTIGDNAFDGCSFTSMTCVGFVLAPTLGWGSNLFVSFPDDGTINVVGGSITSEQALSFAKTKGLNNTWTAI